MSNNWAKNNDYVLVQSDSGYYFHRVYLNKNNMKTITLENGQKVEISEESYNALAEAVQKKETWGEIFDKYNEQRNWKPFDYRQFDPKMNAIRKLLITAKYLNGDWKPNKDDNIWFTVVFENGHILSTFQCNYKPFVCFKTAELATRAIAILGEEVIKTALGDY